MFRRTTRWLTVGMVGFLIALGSCSDESPSNPGDGVDDLGGPDGLDFSRAESALIDSRGGTLRTIAEDGTAYTLVVPPAAVPASTKFTVTPYSAATGNDSLGRLSPGLYLEPSGLQFETPVALIVDLPRLPSSPNAATVVLTGEGGAHDVILPTRVSGRTVTTQLSHFSSVAPATPSQANLELLWDTVVLEIDTYGESIERIETLVSLYLFTLNSGQYPNLPVFPDWPDEIHSALVGILAVGANECASGDCIDGSHTIFHARNLSSAMLFSDLEAAADSVSTNCNQPWVGMDLTYPTDCEPLADGDEIDVTVTVMSPTSGPVVGANVALSLLGSGTLIAPAGITDDLGEWHTTVIVGSSASTNPPTLVATVPDACDPTMEYRHALDSWAVGDTTGTMRFELEYMSVASAVCCGPGDDERAQVKQIHAGCLPPIGPGGSVRETSAVTAPWGSRSHTGALSVEDGSFSVSGGTPSSNSGSGDVVVNGRIIFGTPGGRPLGPNATLHVSMNWSNGSIGFSMMSGGTGSGSSTWPAGTAQFDIPLDEGSTGFVVHVGGEGHGGGGTITFECVQCE